MTALHFVDAYRSIVAHPFAADLAENPGNPCDQFLFFLQRENIFEHLYIDRRHDTPPAIIIEILRATTVTVYLFFTGVPVTIEIRAMSVGRLLAIHCGRIGQGAVFTEATCTCLSARMLPGVLDPVAYDLLDFRHRELVLVPEIYASLTGFNVGISFLKDSIW